MELNLPIMFFNKTNTACWLTKGHPDSICEAPGTVHGQLHEGAQKQDLQHKRNRQFRQMLKCDFQGFMMFHYQLQTESSCRKIQKH